MVRVFHCDDSSAFRLLVREMLQAHGDVEIVGEAGTLDQALAGLPAARPDVLLVDLFEPQRGSDLLRTLREAAPDARLVVYTGMPEDHTPAGADEHVHKSVPFDQLHRVVTRR